MIQGRLTDYAEIELFIPYFLLTNKKLNIKDRQPCLSGEKNQMSKIDKSEYLFNDTLRPADIKKVAPLKVKVIDVMELSTRYGNKRVMLLDNKVNNKETQVFLNAFSLFNLVEAFSDDTDSWRGKEVTLTVENSDRTQKKDSVVVIAKK